MDLSPMFMAAMILLPAVGLTIWVWYLIDQVDEEFSLFSGFDKELFEIGPQAAKHSKGAR